MPASDGRTPSFKDRLLRSCAVADTSEQPTLGSTDWHYLTPEEEIVFAIDRKRFRRMVVTWERYEQFKGVSESSGFDAQTEAARRAYPQWCGPGKDKVLDQWEFADFAKEFGALTIREAVAFFQKYQFWCVRNGITRYKDDPPAEQQSQ